MTDLACACQKYSVAGWRVRCAACGRGTAAAVEPGTLPAGATSSTATGAASGRTYLGKWLARGGSTIEHRPGAATPVTAAMGDRIAQEGA